MSAPAGRGGARSSAANKRRTGDTARKATAKASEPKSKAPRMASAANTPPAPTAAGTAAPTSAPENGALGDGRAKQQAVTSYALLERDTMSLYMSFYKHTYGKSVLDRKVKEYVAIAAALTSGCKNCLEGHLKKAIKHGATRAEISEVMAITLGVAAATVVDRSDIAAANLGLDPETWTMRED